MKRKYVFGFEATPKLWVASFVLTILSLCPSPTNAQLLTLNGAQMAVANSVEVKVNGTIQINASSNISNNGTIDFTGNWTNNSGGNVFGTSAGTVELSGNNQTIGGTNATEFNNLFLLGTGDVTLLQSIGTGGLTALENGVLALNNQQLILNSNTLTTHNSSAGAFTRISGFIVSETEPTPGYGRVRWEVNNPSGGTYVWPFGSDATNDFLPVTLTFTLAGINNGAFVIATYPTDVWQNPNNRPLPTGVASTDDQSGNENAENVVDRWWIIETENYALEPTASLSLTYRDSEATTGNNTIIESTLQMQHNDGLVWSQPPVGANVAATNTAFANGVNDWNYAWVLVESAMPLPIELVEFSAQAVNNSAVLCEWTTASEIGNDYFTIERSVDATHFEEVGVIDGAGNSSVPLFYSFTDQNPYHGISYYRLRQTDFNGEISYSEIRAVEITSASGFILNAFPNPFNGLLAVRAVLPEDDQLKIELRNELGQLVGDSHYAFPLLKGTSNFVLDFSTVAVGVYHLHYTCGKNSGSVKLVKIFG